MTARIERYTVEPESGQGVVIKAPSYAPGPQPSGQIPYVPVDLLEYLVKRFPNVPPPQATHPDLVAVEVAKVWGQQEVIDHLGSILKQSEEK